MTNRKITVTGDTEEDFKLAMKLAFSYYHKKVIGWNVDDGSLLLYWAESEQMTKLPYELNLEDAISFALGWLQKATIATPKPIHDGENARGFQVSNSRGNNYHHEWQVFAIITPIWAIYGK